MLAIRSLLDETAFTFEDCQAAADALGLFELDLAGLGNTGNRVISTRGTASRRCSCEKAAHWHQAGKRVRLVGHTFRLERRLMPFVEQAAQVGDGRVRPR